ncbi:PP2C family protein-serine/threonine phosphatase [Sphaerisporangium sp. TRM90804]|uniref:PP2C family protein-serine/threonine phosphatase n=1 Tax=Sphaerisporangium sp. TRM90804 TaxID=3031113 RepID=UPI002447DF12|nr:PP2C family protein-serine/threonine phosphatase [Sphaerisporangium sp. TRM90804]MDH2430821.1 PP2C family protein-serine/threonine phosphatase [Sphaerisporangium sp. TRM90804]
MVKEGALPGAEAPDRSEGFGERVLGVLLDQALRSPPQSIAPLVAQQVGRMGGRDVSILLQDYAQSLLVPMPGRGLGVTEPQPIDDSPAGSAFLRVTDVQVPRPDGVRVYMPLLDGSDQLGVLACTFDAVDDDDRRLLRRLSIVVAGLLATKQMYTDQFFQVRRREPMSVAAEMQWSLLPPLVMRLPQVELAGNLEPAYEIAGDSFDYALNDSVLHAAVFDAMGHDLHAATMATVAVGAYRHARRAEIRLAEKYAFMDRAIAGQFGPDHFVTAQMMHLNISTGRLEMVNAGHPAPLLIRGHEVARQLEGPTTLPVGFGGHQPRIGEVRLRRRDRVLFYTDGVIEERDAQGRPFGVERLIGCVNRMQRTGERVSGAVRWLSRTLKEERGGRTSDDATLLLIEWRGAGTGRRAPSPS